MKEGDCVGLSNAENNGEMFSQQRKQHYWAHQNFGSWYDYKVINGSPELGDMLEVIDFTSRELLVVINNKLEESDVNYIVNI